MGIHIDNIRKELTREEFVNCLIPDYDIDINGDFVIFTYKGCVRACPSGIGGLDNDLFVCHNGLLTCKDCWLEAIKDINFKDGVKNKESDYKIEHFSFDNDKMEVSVRLKVKSDKNVKNLIEQISQWL